MSVVLIVVVEDKQEEVDRQHWTDRRVVIGHGKEYCDSIILDGRCAFKFKVGESADTRIKLIKAGELRKNGTKYKTSH